MYVLLIMFCGIGLGYFLRNSTLPSKIARLLIPTILALLFCMGALIGENRAIMDNFSSLGLKALFLTVCTLIGSVAIVRLMHRWLPDAPHAPKKHEN